MFLSMIVARSANGAIGKDGTLPWRSPEDLQYFKRLTLAKPVIMGRKTFDSIGRPLPDRTNIVMTQDPDWSADGVLVARGPRDAMAHAAGAREVMIIGGASIYRMFADQADRLYVTDVEVTVKDADTFFPEPDPAIWQEVSRDVPDVASGRPKLVFRVFDRAERFRPAPA